MLMNAFQIKNTKEQNMLPAKMKGLSSAHRRKHPCLHQQCFQRMSENCTLNKQKFLSYLRENFLLVERTAS